MGMIILPVTPFQQNCSLHWCDVTRKAVVIDPGGEVERIVQAISEHDLTVEYILLTHGHLDHVGATAELAGRLGVRILGPHREDEFWFERLPTQCQKFGFPPTESFMPDQWLDHGDTVHFGEEIMEVLHCPGHTPGHVVFHNRRAGLAAVGDVLFRGAIGRTDFPRGDYDTLIASIRDRLWPLGNEVKFIPGHGPMSTFENERRRNPFVSDQALGLS